MHGSVAVKRDGTVSEWGLFRSVNGAPVSQKFPVPVRGLTAVQAVALAAGDKRSLALTNDGIVWEWGAFRITDAIRLPRLGPHQVSGLVGAKAVSTGGAGALALRDNGTVWQWSEPSSPVEVSGLGDVVAITMASHFNVAVNVALKADGTVWEWSGESAPLPVSDLTGVTAIAAADTLRLALKSDGTVWEWIGESAPTQVNGLSGVVAVSVGLRWDFWDGPYPSPCLALRSDGTVWKWSRGEALTEVRGLPGVVAVSAGEMGVALKRDGTVWEWNWGPNLPTMPVQVGGLGRIVALAAGSTSAFSNWDPPEAHRLALKEDGTVWAWGDNRFGQLGDGTTGYRSSPVQVGGLIDVTAISAAAVSSEFGTLPASLAVKRDVRCGHGDSRSSVGLTGRSRYS
jgi:alpha-tubulin suppressor-like RCC1 family protein